MHVELIYSSGCRSYKYLLASLETIIAEEQLPIPVHLIETANHAINEKSPMLRIDGNEISLVDILEQSSKVNKAHHKMLPYLESLRCVLYGRWKEITEAPFAVHKQVKSGK